MEKNSSIKCSVSACRHHNGSQNYCTLNEISIGTHESNPRQVQCTDCESFEVR
ncbi:DUF1540 domain-containing protein [Clostridium taeniosporum]|uniref:DUF1540 domain-containing protein n=1 Tax=Clostridium taeniosporum TaxID=394958 RepID=A0A1D7XNT2_9CLOT|nr:DUF1540 domain-containing protein [Clostridium taeniosporum]AOR24799.1 DUF1540 domain-containing protein [Clostridium taeniosporum]